MLPISEREKSARVIQTSGSAGPDTDAQVERSQQMFDPWLTSRSAVVIRIVELLLMEYDERIAPGRKRKIKARDRANLEVMLHAVIANIVYVIAFGVEPPTVGVSLRSAKQKLTRYDRPGFKGLPKVLETFSGLGNFFTLQKSTRKGIASAIVPMMPFAAELYSDYRFAPNAFRQSEGREPIQLARTDHDFVSDTSTRELIDYRDTSETERYRTEMRTINGFLSKAKIEMGSYDGALVMSSQRQLHRCFNLPPWSEEGEERFDYGGRLFGGWWQRLPKDLRHAIRINGEPIADLDYSSCFLRLAYLQAGTPPPEGDLYAMVPGLSEPCWRDGVKKAASTMLFRTSPLTRLPRDLKGDLPPGTSGAQVRSAILYAHPALKDVFETGIGFRLMFVESQVLVAALLRLVNQGIPALPMHDGLMVARSKADAAAKAMLDASEQVTGVRLPITLKSQYK